MDLAGRLRRLLLLAGLLLGDGAAHAAQHALRIGTPRQRLGDRAEEALEIGHAPHAEKARRLTHLEQEGRAQALDEYVADGGCSPDDIGRIVLSTTLTTNAVVQGNVPPVGVIVSGGPGIDPALYRLSDHYYQVSGAIDHRGRERQALDHHQIQGVADELAAKDVRHVAVALAVEREFVVPNGHMRSIASLSAPLARRPLVPYPPCRWGAFSRPLAKR